MFLIFVSFKITIVCKVTKVKPWWKCSCPSIQFMSPTFLAHTSIHSTIRDFVSPHLIFVPTYTGCSKRGDERHRETWRNPSWISEKWGEFMKTAFTRELRNFLEGEIMNKFCLWVIILLSKFFILSNFFCIGEFFPFMKLPRI